MIKFSLSEGVIYQATVTDNKETYTGLSEPTFKHRYTVQKSNITNREQKGTILSPYIWKLKNSNTTFTLEWHIIPEVGVITLIQGNAGYV